MMTSFKSIKQPLPLLHLILIATLGFMLVSCAAPSIEDKIEKPPEEEDVNDLYNKALEALENENYNAASKYFEDVERQFPYSNWATQAQLMAAYAYYEGQSYDDALLSLDRFIQLHPGNKDVDYAYYLKALCYYEQISDVRRDQYMTAEAMKAFDTLIRRFPKSRYTRDASLKRDLTLDHLAGKEMEIGRYYLVRGQVNAAINRFRAVVLEYQTTTHTAEALHRLVEAYLTLGLTHEATQVAAVLGYNYPGSKWYEKSFKLLDDESRQKILDERGIVDRTVESLFKPD